MKTQLMSASRQLATTLSTIDEGGAGRLVTHGLDRRGHCPSVRYTTVLTIPYLKPNVDHPKLKPTSFDRHTKPDIGLKHYHSKKNVHAKLYQSLIFQTL